MKIGSFEPSQSAGVAADLATDMADRVRGAHRAAEEQTQTDEASSADRPVRDAESIDPVGTELRAQLETVVSDVVSPDAAEPGDLLGKVIDIVVCDRAGRSQLSDDGEYQQLVAGQMRNDPVVVAELDDVLQSIARDLALRDG